MFKCDVCGRELNGITIVNGMSFCAKCYQETFVIPKSLSVKDLENGVEIGCQQCKQKDQRIAELEKENDELKMENNEFCEHNKKLREEIEQLKSELEELKKNVIVPKFKVGDVIWIIKRIKKEVANGKIIKQYSYFNGGTPENLRNVNRWRIRLKNNSEVTKKEYELFYTREEAEEALKKLEENKND